MGKHRNKLAEMLDDGLLDAKTLASDLLGYLSEDDCEDFAQKNDIELFPEDKDEDEDEDEDKETDPFADSFMQPDVSHGEYFEIETSNGTEIVPADVIGRTVGTAAEAFGNYVEGRIIDPDEVIECKSGWLARMSAPGYMDCTNWTAHDTEDEANEYLRETYGND